MRSTAARCGYGGGTARWLPRPSANRGSTAQFAAVLSPQAGQVSSHGASKTTQSADGGAPWAFRAASVLGPTVLAAFGVAARHGPARPRRFASAAAGAAALLAADALSPRRVGAAASPAVSCRAVASGAAPEKSVLSIGLVGFGLVGKELAAQILAQQAALTSEGIEVNVVAVARSKTMQLSAEGLSTLDAMNTDAGEAVDLKSFGEFMAKQPGRPVIVDNTAAEAPAEMYGAWLDSGVSVITPNKRMGSGPFSRYKHAREAVGKGGGTFFYEATVGAGLPVITSLRDLLRTGDTVESIEGVFSGTLSFLFNTLTEESPFSEVVMKAAELGFTEPDPRDDLSGTDVQRKVTILARECGLQLELDDVPVESLVPKPLQSWEPTEEEKAKGLAASFVEAMRPFDGEMSKKVKEAAAAGKVLRYVGVVDVANGKASVELRQFPAEDPFAATQYADNIVAFKTVRYTPRPLVVQGPGAGAAVTAAGVFADILRLA